MEEYLSRRKEKEIVARNWKNKIKNEKVVKNYYNKSPQYNQQTEPKHCKSEVEEKIHKNLETDHHSIYYWK